jgi:single-strand DNA-binding protein
MNQCHFQGRLTRDPEPRSFASGTKKVVFTVAVDGYRGKGQDKESHFLECEAWGKTGDLIEAHFAKGSPIIVHAAAKQEKWTDKETGGNRSKILFNVQSIDFPMGGGKAKKQTPEQDEEPVTVPPGAAADDDIPF